MTIAFLWLYLFLHFGIKYSYSILYNKFPIERREIFENQILAVHKKYNIQKYGLGLNKK